MAKKSSNQKMWLITIRPKDLSDQMASYSSPLRKSVRWYKKLAIDLLLNTSLINALILYKQVTTKNIQIVDFRKDIVKKFCRKKSSTTTPGTQGPKRALHKISRKPGPASKTRRACQECYKQNVISKGREYARNKTKKVTTYCETCLDKPFICLECFNTCHN